jgi:UDP-glucose 4-epimerase
MPKFLVTGGAGYIGSHMTKMLVNSGHEVITLDNLSTGFRELAKYGKLIVGDLTDENLLDGLFSKHQFDGVMHFAATSLVGESMTDPSKYYRNNVSNTINLLDAMVRHNVKSFVFSSSAAVYGKPNSDLIDEDHTKVPINPYGSTKLMIERILQDYASAYGLNSISLRYFNACGADPEGELGECHDPETHLIPLVLQAASNRRESITVFGRDYATDDGTCVRDYIHINDLCSAHALALNKLFTSNDIGALAFNLGNSSGFSVRQVIDVVQEVVGREGYSVTVIDGNRREGDPDMLVADAAKAKSELGWAPSYTDLETIISQAWEWEKKLASIN